MNFDFSWFLSIPGMLITGGVLLLIVAVIILIVTSRKSKKMQNPVQGDANATIQAAVPTATNVLTPVVPTPAVSPMNNGMPLPEMNSSSVNAPNTLSNMPTPVETPSNVSNVMPAVPTSPMASSVNAMPMGTVDMMPNVAPVPEASVSPVAPVSTSPEVAPASTVSEVTPIAPIEPSTSSFAPPSIPVIEPTSNGIENVAPATPTISSPEIIQDAATIVQPVSNETVAPMVSDPAPIITPTVSNVTPITPEVVPNAPVVETSPAVTPEVVSPAPTVVPNEVTSAQPTPVIESQQPQPVIYGGASPIVPNMNVNPEPSHQIYGGANPLENTQTIPVVNTPTVQPVPVVEPTLVTPQVQPVTPVVANGNGVQ